MSTVAEHITIEEREPHEVRNEHAEKFVNALVQSEINQEAQVLIQRAEELAQSLKEFNDKHDEDSINRSLVAAGLTDDHAAGSEYLRGTARDILAATRGFAWACQQFSASAGSAAW